MNATGQRIAYLRVSSEDQNLARQFEAVGDVDKTFQEKTSGGTRAGRRAALAELISYARAGDIVIAASIDRMARSIVDMRQIVDELLHKGVAVQFVKENLTFEPDRQDSFATFQLNIMASFAEFERALIRERQAEGIKAAKARGVYKGRAKSIKPEQLAEASQWLEDGLTKAEAARKLGVDRSTLYRALSAAEAAK
ncbi:transposase [Sinomonas cyclohexanicum]|uniref:Transposase n=1 Tax=Sinomonas cyclohexanicum TaxID=322009 RepID=A0ABN6FIX4_SINCY|nr:recombinase family protein [Corynebacterium cyclohexanicum]BCT75991.1 transposase [Corynebacterium cyclohexanicum]